MRLKSTTLFLSVTLLFGCRVYRVAPPPDTGERVVVVRQAPEVIIVQQPPHVIVVNQAPPVSPAEIMMMQAQRERLERERWEQEQRLVMDREYGSGQHAQRRTRAESEYKENKVREAKEAAARKAILDQQKQAMAQKTLKEKEDRENKEREAKEAAARKAILDQQKQALAQKTLKEKEDRENKEREAKEAAARKAILDQQKQVLAQKTLKEKEDKENKAKEAAARNTILARQKQTLQQPAIGYRASTTTKPTQLPTGPKPADPLARNDPAGSVTTDTPAGDNKEEKEEEKINNEKLHSPNINSTEKKRNSIDKQDNRNPSANARLHTIQTH